MLTAAMDRPLHPNLAQIAAAYDDVMQSFRAGLLSPVEARRRVLTLVARDDNGLEWSINPDTGQWQYRSHFGELVSANPPAYGVVGFSPADIGGGEPAEGRVALYEIDQRTLYTPGQLRGATMLGERPAGARRGPRRVLVIAAAVLGAGLLAVLAAQSGLLG
jgi:hypothetical protein